MMKLHVVDTGFFKLDGGAMFGIVPKAIWQKLNPADENNLCTWAMRCLLIDAGNRKILIDTGIGDKQDAKFFSYFQPHGDTTLMGSLTNLGYRASDITDVVLTHLHFDHCGGAVIKTADGILAPAFENATYWSNEIHWEWAVNPNAREKASFLKENFIPLQEHGVLRFAADKMELIPGVRLHFVNGHTEAMMLVEINTGSQTVIYMADLIPSSSHIPLPYIMAYDVRPLITLDEKTEWLTRAYENNWVLFFEHDPQIECCRLKQTEKGLRMDQPLRLAEALQP